MELRSLFLVALLVVVSVILVACEGSSRDQAAAEPAGETDATETPPADPPSQASKPEPRAESGNEGNEEEHTPEPDAVAQDRPVSSDLAAAVVGTIDAVQRGDAQYLRDLAEVVAVGCTYADGLGGPPKCAEGDAQGTVYEVFPFLGCHGGWVPLSELTALFEGLLPLTGELHAVVRLERGAGGDPFARGDTLIVFEPAGSPTAPEAVGLTLAGGRLVRADYGCRTADQMRIEAEGPVARTLDAVQRGDAQLLRTLAKVMAVACTHADGAGGRPKCAEGDAEGTGYEVFPFLGCQGGWVLASELKDFFDELLPLTGELRAVARLERGAGGDPHTRGDTLIVFEPADSRMVTQAVGLALANSRFVRVERGCRTADQMLRNPDGSSRELLHSPSRE